VNEAVAAAFAKAYKSVKRSRQDPAPDDRLVEDLDLDSLDAIDMLSLIEVELGSAFNLEKVSESLSDVVTVSDLIDRVEAVLREGATASD
jgi:acyl carrier protein